MFTFTHGLGRNSRVSDISYWLKDVLRPVNLIMEIKFQCPRCGGCHFGASDYSGEYIVSCHDEYSGGCSWSGPYDFEEEERKVDEVIKMLADKYHLKPFQIENIWDALSELPIE